MLVVGENNIDLAVLAEKNPGCDFKNINDITLWSPTSAAAGKTVNADNPASVVITDFYMEKPDYVYDPTKDEDPGVTQTIPDGYVTLLTGKGTLSDGEVTNYFSKGNGATSESQSEISNDGRAGGAGIKVTSINTAKNSWDSQFWIKFNDVVPKGTKIHIEFDYRASATALVSSFQQTGSFTYKGGGLNSFTASTKWAHFTQDFTISEDDVQCIAFNLNETKDSVISFFFDNFFAYREKPITNWTNIVVNSTMEGTDNQSFFKTEQGVGGPFFANIEDGIGKDDSRGIAVHSSDNPTQDWDSQFFVKLTKQLPTGTKYRVSFDYKASQATSDNKGFDTQAHDGPGNFKHWAFIGSKDFSESWQTFKAEGTVPQGNSNNQWVDIVCNTIAFNLAKNKQETIFYFDNFVFEIPTDDADTLSAATATASTIKQWPADASFTVTNAGYSSFSYAHPVQFSDVQAFVAVYENGAIDLREISGIPANTAAIIQAEAGTYTAKVANAPAPEANSLKVSDGAAKGDGSTIYVLANGEKHGVGFYLLADGVTIPAGKAYLEVPAVASETAREFIAIGNDATAIKAVENLKKSGMIFNLAGQQVKKAQKGIYIIDGKKAIVK